MFEVNNPLLTLCVAASILEKQDVYASQKQNLATVETQKKSKGADFQETCKVKFAANMDFKTFTPKIPNHLITEYIENTSDELRKKFSFKCKFSPNICSEVVESYGSETKAFSEIKQHVWNFHILGNAIEDLTDRKLVTSSINKMLKPIDETSKFWSRSSKRFSSVKTVSQRESNRGKPILEKPDKADEFLPLDMPSEIDNSDSLDILKFGQYEHDYAKRDDEVAVANPARGARQNKNQQGKLDAYKRWTLSELQRHINGDSYLMPSTIRTGPFPFVHTPEPFEPAQVVELHSNGDPVDLIRPVYIQSSTSRISSKKVMENKVNKKKSKFPRIINVSRSVLECVENRVACKPNSLSEQRDALAPDDCIENSENVEKSIHEIAWKNIRILSQQRRKRKYRDKPSVYICEICKKHFTANTSLTYHYLGHLKIKPFKCHICCRTFTRRHSLKYHMMIHANKNRFQCSTCKRLFRHPSHYKEHLRKHTGEEPYSCKFCSNKFKTRNSFKRHLKLQHQKILTTNGIVSVHDDS